MTMPANLYALLKAKSLVAWYPFEESPAITSGYTPNVADETDGSPNRLPLNSFIVGDSCGNGALTLYDDPSSGNADGPSNADMQITGDFTALIRYKWIDNVGNPGNMFTVYLQGSETEAGNVLIYIRQNTDGTIHLVHEYGAGVNETINTVVADPRDGSTNFFMVKRDANLKKYYVSINNGTVYEYSYANNPTGGSSATVSVGGPAGTAQADGDYYDVFVFDELLTAEEVLTIYYAGRSNATWFDYRNWNGISGYVAWVVSIDVYALRQVLGQIQPTDTFIDDALYNLPVTDGWVETHKEVSDDLSVYGQGFRPIPVGGIIVLSGTVTMQVDDATFGSLIQYLLTPSPLTYGDGDYGATLPYKNDIAGANNTAALSMYFKDAVAAWKLTKAYIQKWTLKGTVGEHWELECDIISTEYERVTNDTLPSSYTLFGTPYTFHEGSLSINEINNNLTNTLYTTSFELSVDNGNLELVDNLGVVEPVFSNPSQSCKFTVRHDSNQFLDWQDNETRLYLELNISDALYFTMTNCIATVELDDDALTMQDIELHIGKNGIGSNYKNTKVIDNRPLVIGDKPVGVHALTATFEYFTTYPGTYLLQMTYDPVRKVFVTLSTATLGLDGRVTYECDLNGNWTLIESINGASDYGASGHIIYDERNNEIIRYGGYQPVAWDNRTLYYTGSTWAFRVNGPRNITGNHMCYDYRTQRILSYGGDIVIPTMNDALDSWDGTTWTELSNPSLPGNKSFGEIAYDGRTERIILFGGYSSRSPDVISDANTYAWNNSAWANVTPATGPSARVANAMIWHPGVERVVMFGGVSGGSTLKDLWVWDGYYWDEINISSALTVTPTFNSWARMCYVPDWDAIALEISNANGMEIYKLTLS